MTVERAGMTDPHISSPASVPGRLARATRFAKAHRPQLAVPVVLLYGQQLRWAVVVATVAAVIEVVRFLRSPLFMRIRLPAERHRHD
jgi:hypothetical protein